MREIKAACAWRIHVIQEQYGDFWLLQYSMKIILYKWHKQQKEYIAR